MIVSANKKKLTEISPVPDVSDGIIGFLRHAIIEIVQKQQVDGYTEEIPIQRETMAHAQPMPERMVALKEGNRSWSWFLIYVECTINLKNDEIVILFGTRYRIMQRDKWSEFGFIRYQAIEDYVQEG
jgi:hypothetical protein